MITKESNCDRLCWTGQMVYLSARGRIKGTLNACADTWQQVVAMSNGRLKYTWFILSLNLLFENSLNLKCVGLIVLELQITYYGMLDRISWPCLFNFHCWWIHQYFVIINGVVTIDLFRCTLNQKLEKLM